MKLVKFCSVSYDHVNPLYLLREAKSFLTENKAKRLSSLLTAKGKDIFLFFETEELIYDWRLVCKNKTKQNKKQNKSQALKTICRPKAVAVPHTHH